MQLFNIVASLFLPRLCQCVQFSHNLMLTTTFATMRLFLLILFLISIGFTHAQIRLPMLVRDSMIVQRDTKLKIWGWATKDEKVTVKFNGKSYKTTTGADGKWLVTLNPVKAGGPYTMEISGTNTITLRNVLAGDVWLCSGQSNMYHYLELHRDYYEKEIAAANNPEIRQFQVPLVVKLDGVAADYPNSAWKTATQDNIMKFSVVGYFFAKALYDQYHVPIGIINASYGGSPAEAWISEEGLQEFPDFLKVVTQNKDTAYVNNFKRIEQARAATARNKPVMDAGMTGPLKWYDPAFVPKNWSDINIPGFWEDQGVKDLDGVVWYRREIDVPASMTGVPAIIYLGRIVDADQLYVNGSAVGSTGYQYPQRRYNVPAGVLKEGKNIFVIRVTNSGGKGGFVPGKPYHISAGGQTLDLKGYWQYKVGEIFDKKAPEPEFILRNQPTGLFNGMLNPMLNYSIRGFAWYQGEANAVRAQEYKMILPALITDWRTKFGQGDLPFLYVQLPDFMDVDYYPGEGDWALLREAQLQTLLVPRTAMVVTIGLGAWNDIHPHNKKPIGDRLALAARRVAYGETALVHAGPMLQSQQITGNKIIVAFKETGSGLTTCDGEELHHFAIAGEDRKFVWAKAVIKGNTVEVWSDQIPSPMYVRYAWANNPAGANLCNQEGLPASPFRTDF
jgi:sialate O-acetylesterase